jgi:hypothetical protein
MRGTADTTLVKPGHQVTEFGDQKSIEEFKLCCDPVNGPLYFMTNFLKIQHPTKGSVNFQPYPYQLDLIKSYVENRYSVNMLGRQMGKCLSKEVNITIRNKAGDVYDIPIGEFYEYQAAKQNNDPLPDISKYKRSE